MYQFLSYVLKLLVIFELLVVGGSLKTYAQSVRKIDSLKALTTVATGLDRFDALYDLGFEYYFNGDISNALRAFTEGQGIAYQYGDSLRIVKSTRVKFQMLRRMDRANEGIEELAATLPIATRNRYKDEVQYILNLLAIYYTLQANYDMALEYHFRALQSREEDGDHRAISETLNNIGIVYFKLSNYSKAIEFYKLALEHDRQVNHSEFRSQLLVNLGLCYNQIKDFDNARSLLREGMQYCEPNCSQDIIIAGELALGKSYFGQGLFSKAQSHFVKSLALANSSDKVRFVAENLVSLAHIYITKEQYDSALTSLHGAEKIAMEQGYNELLIESYKEYFSLYSVLQDFQNASLYQRRYIVLKDSIYSAELIERISRIQTDFQERVNIKTIAEKEETIARQRALNISIAIIAILAGALIFVLYKSIKVKRKVNADLSDAKAIIEDQNRQLRSSNVILNKELQARNADLQKANDSLQRVNEELDNFIYKTSHDIRGPLASLKGMCNVALMDVKDPLALNYLEKLDLTADKLNTILTRLLIVNQINNSVLHQTRIDFDTIVDDVLVLERKKGLPQRLTINKNICPKVAFYSDPEFVRIILENLIDNAIKFYNDSDRVNPFVNISIFADGDFVSINVVDNGIGISEVHPDKIFQMFSRASERSQTGGIGLYITKTATEKLGGTVHLKTTPEGYTEFYVKLPYTHTTVLA